MDSAKTSGSILKTYSVRVVDNAYNPIDVISAVTMDIGKENVRGCVKTNGQWIITLKSTEDADLLQETGLRIGNDSCTVTGVTKSIVTVSCFGVPCYIEDDELTGKLKDLGCLIKSKWTRKYYSEFPEVENGIRFVRIELPPKAKSLPYAINIGGEHIRLKHNGQTKVCNKCLSDDHIMRDCPQYTCRECGTQGHTESRCPGVKCYKCNHFGHKSFLCEAESTASHSESEPMEGKPEATPAPAPSATPTPSEIPTPTNRKLSVPADSNAMDTATTTKATKSPAETKTMETNDKSSVKNKAKTDQKPGKTGTKRTASSDEEAFLETMVKQKIQTISRRMNISPNLRLARMYKPKEKTIP